MKNLIWVEKYRPKTIEETILPNNIKEMFYKFRDKKEIPNLLLSGPAGTGKTTIAKALIKELGYDYMMVNGSDSSESGIDALRTRIKSFASSMSLVGEKKVVLIDECDHLSPAVQPALREFMERFSSVCTFILTCNYRNRIIAPLQSRLSLIDFYIPTEEKGPIFKQFNDRVCDILTKENVEFDEKIVATFIVKHFPDFRKVINELQKFGITGSIDNTILSSVKEDVINDLFGIISKKNFTGMRKWVSDNMDLGSAEIFRKLFELSSKYITMKSIAAFIVILADYQYKAVHVPDEELNMVACLTEVMADCEVK